MKSTVFVFLMFVSLGFLSLNAQEKKGTENKTEAVSPKFDPARDAAKDIKTAIATAKKLKKNVMLDVGGEWCIWCKRLDKLFEDNKDLSDFLHSNYEVVKVNYSPENKNEKVLAKYPKVAGYPHLFVLDKNGKLLHSQNTGDLESGKGHDPQKVMAFLKQWAPKK